MIRRERLSQEHAELSALATELLACLDRAAPDLERIGRIRWCMTRKLGQHLTKEDQLLYPRVRAGADPRAAATAERFAREMGGLSEAYRSYMTSWTVDAIQARWPAFAADTRSVMRALAHRIEREETELYPLLDMIPARADVSRAAVR